MISKNKQTRIYFHQICTFYYSYLANVRLPKKCCKKFKLILIARRREHSKAIIIIFFTDRGENPSS